MSYTALYRKYRPANFSQVLGQEHIVKTLKNQIVTGKISHAYLFCGTRGTGKTSMAKILAKAINCTQPNEGEPCGICRLCKEIAAERSLNVLEIDAASNNGVDNIRDLKEEVRYTPTEGTFKVYIIDEVHMLSGGAFNALLKTLEEPPSHVIFILATTDPGKIPATIHSRCQRYDFRRISSKEISERIFEYLDMEGVCASNEAVEHIARLSDGSMRDALSLLDRVVSYYEGEEISLEMVLEVTGGIDSSSFFQFTDKLNKMDSAGALSIIGKIMDDGKDIWQFIADGLCHFRNILISKSVEDCGPVLDISPENALEIKKQAENMDSIRIMSYIKGFSELQSTAKYTVNPRILLEIEIIKFCNPEIINNNYEELYNKILKIEKDIKNNAIAPPMQTADVKPAQQKKKTPVKKVVLPADFEEVEKKYGEIKSKLLEKREGIPFAGILEDTKIGFLDDKYLYVVFEDTCNQDSFKDYPSRQELLNWAVMEITGKNYQIKSITREEYEAKLKGVTIVPEKEKTAEKLVEKLKSDIVGMDIEVKD